MRQFYNDNPTVQNVGKVDTEKDWFSPIITTLIAYSHFYSYLDIADA